MIEVRSTSWLEQQTPCFDLRSTLSYEREVLSNDMGPTMSFTYRNASAYP